MAKTWLIYDCRYRYDPDAAICMEVCDSLEEAEENTLDHGDDTVIVEYDEKNNILLNPKIIN